MKRALFAGIVAVLVGCMTPPAPPAPVSTTTVNASFGKTWNAVIDQFAASTIPIKTMDRSSGFIATDPLTVDPSLAATGIADCGKDLAGVAQLPTNATYNVIVRGDSTASTVHITVNWTYYGTKGLGSDKTMNQCSTTAKWETDMQQRIKAAAEAAK